MYFIRYKRSYLAFLGRIRCTVILLFVRVYQIREHSLGPRSRSNKRFNIDPGLTMCFVLRHGWNEVSPPSPCTRLRSCVLFIFAEFYERSPIDDISKVSSNDLGLFGPASPMVIIFIRVFSRRCCTMHGYFTHSRWFTIT